jgi:hypothetical protein
MCVIHVVSMWKTATIRKRVTSIGASQPTTSPLPSKRTAEGRTGVRRLHKRNAQDDASDAGLTIRGGENECWK